ncbi:hypothetical protein H4S08_002334 [Coemansia sp. RSA 1365]|nr:hypothetical protein H4S08_002334 [Coemansia sp. RSA 1365]
MTSTSVEARRDEFWQTLTAMGFDAVEACSGTYSGVYLDSCVFERGIYHMKAAELILQFLLMHLDETRFKREFFDCWPIGDPRQARDFRTHVFKWLDELRRGILEKGEEIGQWPTEVPVRRSFVDECKGIRFEEVLWTLCRIVAQKLLRKGGVWAKHIKHPLIEMSATSKEENEAIVKASDACRARYARLTRDRIQAQKTWQQTEDILKEQITKANEKQQLTREEFRICRKRLGNEVDPATVPDVESSAADVGQMLDLLASEARRLWSGSFGWIEKHSDVVAAVEAVVEKRANSVRLEGKKHLRLVPPPQMADQWTQWLAERQATPFRTAGVDLHVLAQMATASVAALRRGIAVPADSSPVLKINKDIEDSNQPAPQLQMADESGVEKIQHLDDIVGQQETRIARLKRIRAQLVDQRSVIGQHISKSFPDKNTRVTDNIKQLTSIISTSAQQTKDNEQRTPVNSPHTIEATDREEVVVNEMTERVHQLADVWEELVTGEEYSENIIDAALNGTVIQATPFSAGTGSRGVGMSFMSDYHTKTPLSMLAGGMATLSCTRKRPLDTSDLEGLPTPKRRDFGKDTSAANVDDMLLDDEEPDFLVE